MSNSIRWIQNYLFYTLSLVLISMAWDSISPEREVMAQSSLVVRALWEILSWNLILWFAMLVVFLIMLIVLPEARERTLNRLANIKERDEREQQITGKASRAAYISTLSLMIFLLFISLFSFSIYHVPEERAVNGKTGTVSIGFGFSLFDKPQVKTDANNKVLFESKDIPLSKSAIILLLIVWQLTVFNIRARKENSLELKE